jgi:hypothetical protein
MSMQCTEIKVFYLNKKFRHQDILNIRLDDHLREQLVSLQSRLSAG